MLVLLPALVVILFFPTSTYALFVLPPVKVISYPQLKLATADLLRIPYQGIAYDAGEAASYPTFALTLNADFGTLDCVTFLCLQDAYCGWSETKSRVKWKEGESYTLLDFLPPIMQAVSGLYFKSSRQLQPALPSFLGGPNTTVQERVEQQVILTTNCWGFAWEVLFQADNKDVRQMQISTADPKSAYAAFSGPGFYLVQTSRFNSKLLTNTRLRNKGLKAGDVLLIWHQIPGQDLYLDHTAIVIDDDVYYEKSGSGDQTPFRLTTWEGITANFPPGIFTWEWRRLVRNRNVQNKKEGKFRLKSAMETFGLDQQLKRGTLPSSDRFNVINELFPSVQQSLTLQAESGNDGTIEGNTYTGIYVLEDLVFSKKTGRATLPLSAFSDLMLPRLPSNPYLRAMLRPRNM
jgi:hypothetical protein